MFLVGTLLISYLVNNIHAMELAEKRTQSDKIIMRIFPAVKFGVEDVKDHPDIDGVMIATLEGFQFKNDQVLLISDQKENKDFPFMCGDYIYNDQSYCPQELELALRNGSMSKYPIHMHRKLTYLTGDEQLTVLQHNDRNSEPIEIELCEHTKKRMLTYLCNDIYHKDEQCFSFFKKIYFDTSEETNNSTCATPFTDQIEMIDDEASLKPGDGIVLFSHESDQKIRLKHYAIFLNKGIYISKFGNKGVILVTDRESMLQFWKCTGAAKVKPDCAHLESFIKTVLSTIPLTDKTKANKLESIKKVVADYHYHILGLATVGLIAIYWKDIFGAAQ